MENRKTILILTTGGTIAGKGVPGDITGYTPGAVMAGDLLGGLTVPSGVSLETVEVCSKNSDDIDCGDWHKLLTELRSGMERSDIAGMVVLHGTDTMEETAFLLSLTLEVKKPVVITGSMRPSTAISADGPLNIKNALTLALCEKAARCGVLVTMDGGVYTARGVTKRASYGSDAFEDEYYTPGRIFDDEVYLDLPDAGEPVFKDLDLSFPLPGVPVVYFTAGSDPKLLSLAAGISGGLVIAGAGAGEYSEGFGKVIEELSIPVVISSRTGRSYITEKMLLSGRTVPAGALSPVKAAILLRLALHAGYDAQGIRELFESGHGTTFNH